VTRIYEDIRREVTHGEVATYIPILAEADREAFSLSICTVDGQQFSLCTTSTSPSPAADVSFSFQSCVKPLVYAVTVEDRGLTQVHRHVGYEPSGLSFNSVSLNQQNLPHNPMINAGAIATGALLGPGLDSAAKFRYFLSRLTDLAGGQRVGFSHATYLCEHETAWRNNALVAYMTDAGVFPKHVQPAEALDFYLQACSIEVNTAIVAAIAATLAAGGVNPLTGKLCLNPATTKAVLSLAFSCGLYDASGMWMSSVSLPAKSGVSGCIYAVIPHVLGISVFSPPLDGQGNSVRAVEFYKRLAREYNFGVFDQIVTGERQPKLYRQPTSAMSARGSVTGGGRGGMAAAAAAAAGGAGAAGHAGRGARHPANTPNPTAVAGPVGTAVGSTPVAAGESAHSEPTPQSAASAARIAGPPRFVRQASQKRGGFLHDHGAGRGGAPNGAVRPASPQQTPPRPTSSGSGSSVPGERLESAVGSSTRNAATGGLPSATGSTGGGECERASSAAEFAAYRIDAWRRIASR
jgi:glutaminase